MARDILRSSSMNNLAGVLRDKGKSKQAEEKHRQALRLRETVLGKEHPDTLTSMDNLAEGLRDQGKYEQAEEMHRQARRLREIVLGKRASLHTDKHKQPGVSTERSRRI